MKKTVKSIICIIIVFALSAFLFACNKNSIKNKESELIEIFYSDKHDTERNEIVKALWGTTLDAKLNSTGFYSGKLVDDYEKEIKECINESWGETVKSTSLKVRTYAETNDISFTNDEAEEVTISLVVHLVENYDYYYPAK